MTASLAQVSGCYSSRCRNVMFVMSSGIGALRVRRSGVITLQDLTGDFLSAAITLTRRLIN